MERDIGGGLWTYSDLSLAALLLVHILNPDVLFSEISCCAHDEVANNENPPSLSPLIMLFTNADSIADIRSRSSTLYLKYVCCRV